MSNLFQVKNRDMNKCLLYFNTTTKKGPRPDQLYLFWTQAQLYIS